jgi:hypothetical protein
LENILTILLFVPHEEDVFLQTDVFVKKGTRDQNVNSMFALENPPMTQKYAQEEAHVLNPTNVRAILNNILDKNVNMQFVLENQQQIRGPALEMALVLNSISVNAT